MSVKKPVNLRLYIGIAILVVAVFTGYGIFQRLRSAGSQTVVTHEAIIEEIKTMGKMELATLYVKDIIEYKEERAFLPDSKVLLMVSGEVNGCVDLQKLKDKDLELTEDKLVVYLPPPEICFSKVDHEHSKVYEKTSWILLDDDAELIDKTYKEADKYLKSPAVTQKAMQTAAEKAPEILEPIFKKISGKKTVEIRFRTTPVLP